MLLESFNQGSDHKRPLCISPSLCPLSFLLRAREILKGFIQGSVLHIFSSLLCLCYFLQMLMTTLPGLPQPLRNQVSAISVMESLEPEIRRLALILRSSPISWITLSECLCLVPQFSQPQSKQTRIYKASRTCNLTNSFRILCLLQSCTCCDVLLSLSRTLLQPLRFPFGYSYSLQVLAAPEPCMYLLSSVTSDSQLMIHVVLQDLGPKRDLCWHSQLGYPPLDDQLKPWKTSLSWYFLQL